MARIELHTVLDRGVLREIVDLIAATTEIEGHRPVGEHKYSHLAVGATGWVGVLAYTAGRLVGYAHTRWNAPTAVPRMAVEVVVHPAHRGEGEIARQLLEATCGVLARAGGGVLYLWVHRVQDPGATLAARMGFAVQRQLAFMTRALEERPPAPALPDGVEVRAYREGIDDAALLAVNNAAFKGHPENGDWDAAELADRRSRSWFDAAGLLLAWRGDELLGFHWTKWHGHDSDEVPAHEPVGEVYVLAVHPSAEGLGLGRALLVAGLGHLYDRGCRGAMLYVDAASTGAVRLYERAGFTLAYTDVCYEDDVAPVADTDDDLRRPS